MQFDLATAAFWVKAHFLLLLELALVLGLLALSFVIRESPALEGLWQGWCRLAKRPLLSLLLPAALALALRLALLPFAGAPYPALALDEFSYLLAGDTFASGRLTNPPHPQFRHFESPHVIYEPTYMSKYPPGQGLVLALGQRLGHPWIGVLLSTTGMIVAAGWALQAWLPPPYALLGTTLLALRIGVLSYWANSYWGGAVAAIGGALLIGSLPRLARSRIAAGSLLGLGLALMAFSRPFEGFVFSASVLVIWAFQQLRGRRLRFASLLPALGCGALVMGVLLGWLAYYHQQVTGDPLEMPYQVWQERYQSVAFTWNTPELEYHPPNPQYGLYSQWVIETYQERASLISRSAEMAEVLVTFFWGPALSLFVALALPCIAATRRYRLLVLAMAVTLVTVGVSIYTFSHYVAPLTAVFTIVGIYSTRAVVVHARRKFTRWKMNRVLVFLGLPVVFLVLNVVGGFLVATDRLWTTPTSSNGWCCFLVTSDRAAVEQKLLAETGKHLLFVRQPADRHSGTNWIWTYNAADVDASKIVWVMELSPRADCRLRQYYSDRQVWLADTASEPPQVQPFPDNGCPSDPAGRGATNP